MTKATKAAGTRRELQVVNAYRAQGCIAFRTPASLGVCDVIAMRRHIPMPEISDVPKRYEPPPLASEVVMAEVKANLGGPYMNFRKPERNALRLAARVAGARAVLVHWPPGGKLTEIPEDQWPTS